MQAQNTAMALLLFFFVVPVFTFLLTPLMSLLSRRHEFEPIDTPENTLLPTR